MTDGVKSDTWNIVGGYTSMSYSHLEQEGKVYQIAFQMSRRGGGGRGGRQERKKDVWDVEGGYMGMKKQKLEEQFKEQVCSTLTHNVMETIPNLKSAHSRQIWRSKRVGSLQGCQFLSMGAQILLLRSLNV